MTTRLERELLKRLDELDDQFNLKFDEYIDKVIYLPLVFSINQVASWQLPHAGELSRILTNHVQEMFSAGQAHGDVLVRELHRKYGKHKLADWRPSFQRLSVGFEPETFWLTPEGAITALEKRSILLAGDMDGSISQAVKGVMLNHLNGVSRLETEAALTKIKDINQNRARLITTTETTYAYNRGRLVSFHENEVDYVRFSAVIDARTSPQCRSRHGKVMRMDSSLLASNTPPLHGRCRSVLSPVYSIYQREMITPESTDWSKAAPLPKGWRTGPEGDILKAGSAGRMEELNQAKKRDHKIAITDIAIQKVPLISIKEFTAAQNKQLQEEHRNVLRIAKEKNNSNEVLSICKTDFSKRVYTLGSEFGVDPNTNFEAIMLIKRTPLQDLFYIHNHPSTNVFSTDDIIAFIEGHKVKLMSVVTNQGEVYILHKSEKYDYNKTRKILRNIGKNYNESNFDGDEIVKCFLKECRDGGVDYEQR